MSALRKAIEALLAQILADENDGGLLSRETHRRAGDLRQAIAFLDRECEPPK